MLLAFLASLLFGASAPGAPGGLALPAAIADSATQRETRKVGSFDAIDAGGAYELAIDAGAPATSVVVEGPPDLVGKITTEVRGRTLHIEEQQATFNWSSSRTLVTVDVASLAALEVGGAITAGVKNLHGPAFSLTISGAGKAKVAGTVDALSADLAGAANLDAIALKARRVKISIAGTGSAKVWASDSIAADVSGVGSVTYYGKPAHVAQSIAGVGSIKAAP